MRAYYNNLIIMLIIIMSMISFLGEFAASSGGDRNGVYIVYMGKTTSSVNGDPRHDHAQLLNELNTRKENVVVQTYNKSFLGFAARLSKEQAQSFAQRPQVVSVFPNRAFKLQTTRSWNFLMTQNAGNGFSHTASPHVSDRSVGSHDTIIGILDTGIWPKHPSFDDECMGPIPQHWNGICMAGKNATNKFTCNKKVIGARYYDDPDEPGFMTTPMDELGHGSHVASTAAGIPVWGASYYGIAKGIARGGSIGSRLAVYRVCAQEGCWSTAILKAFDDAIDDGVDVISISISGEFQDFFTDTIAIGAFHAVEKGISVVASAGNRGPLPGTVNNVAPWILSVAATTIDRDFEATILLGRDKKIKGGGINVFGLNKSAVYPLIDGLSARSNQTDVVNASNCVPGSLDTDKVIGKIILCEDEAGFFRLKSKIRTLKKQGAVGIIMINEELRRLSDYYGTTPLAVVTKEDGAQIQSYINTKSNPLATILPTLATLNNKPAPVVPFFSSRGPINGVENLLKPDVTAPGVGILAAWPPLDDGSAIPGMEPPLFKIESGTSMSCPHVSGIAAIVKSHYPTWNPSAIISAIMTTAIKTNNLHAPITTDTGSIATPYDIGAGQISMFGSLSPGLVYETGTIDYIKFLCNMGYNTSMVKVIASTVPDNFTCPSNSSPNLISDMNYPSIVVSGLKPNEKRAVTRTVTNVGEAYSTFTASVVAPSGVQVEVVPNKLVFKKNIKSLSFEVIFTLMTTSADGDMFGTFTWSSRKNKVRSPFVVHNA